jgi:hypothetical protein
MGRGLWLRGLALALLVAMPSFGKPRWHAPAKTKSVKPTPAAPVEAAAETSAGTPPETPVKAPSGKDAGRDGKAPGKVTATEESESDKGVKTYKFNAVEVEGRLKSPQIVYFLRRVRAEFEAGDLGHRSFMPELSDTRRSACLR